MAEKLYFAYGSNINLEQMEYRCPAAKAVGPVILENYELLFRGNTRGNGVATIAPREGSKVHGLLWWITPACEQSLDFYEGYPRLYEKEQVTVRDDKGSQFTVMAYVMTGDERWMSPTMPSAFCYRGIQDGYRQNGLPVEGLKRHGNTAPRKWIRRQCGSTRWLVSGGNRPRRSMTRNDNIHRKDGAEMSGRKFSFYDAADGSLDPLFTSKLQEEAQMGCLRGVFLGEEVGDDVMVTWLPNNKRLDSFTFRKELYELIGELQSGEMLGSLPAMIAFCQAHPEARMSDRQTFYAFRMDSSKYRYHLRLFPDKQKFYIFCYQTDRMREGRPAPDHNYLYRGKTKRRSGKGERE